jgi:DNA polymerase-2
MAKGFILHPTYRIERGRPVVHLFGRLDTGETFVVRDDRMRPYFFIRRSDVAKAQAIMQLRIETCDLVTMDGEPVVRVVLQLPPDTPGIRDRLQAKGIPCYEADIPFATRYLIDQGIRGSLEVEGPHRPGRIVGRIYENPELRPAEWVPELSVLSLDIETDARGERVLAVALCGPELQEVHLLQTELPVGRLPTWVRAYPDEATLLRALQQRLRELDPDVLTGWNVIDFDLAVLERRFRAHRIPFLLGRADLPCRIQPDRSAWGASRAVLPGRVVLDGLGLLRGSFVRMEDYRLDTVAKEVLGEGKTLTMEDRAPEIERLHREDPAALAEYNLTDARLVLNILEKLHLIPLTIQRSLLTGMPMDRVAASIASFDFLYLSELRKRGMVAPSVNRDVPVQPTAGGYVLESTPGIYENILVFDYRSLYPSLIRTFRLDPVNLIPEGREEPDAIVAPNGARFGRHGGILPDLLERLFPAREEAQRRGDRIAATAIKILMNSFYGVLATPRCRFYSSPTANAITSFGQMILRWTKEAVERRGHRVLYGDTDSIFVESGLADPEEARALGERLAGELNEEISRRIQERYGVPSHLLLKFDRLFRKFFLPGLRHSREGSKKRYAGLVEQGGHLRLVFTGLESVRRDWTDLAKTFQQDLLRLVFEEGEASAPKIEAMIRDFVARLRAGELDHLLVYRKALRKEIAQYTKTTPPHVKAAQKLGERAGHIIAYVMTTEGPEPVQDRKAPLDYDHYIEKQLRPVAEAILPFVGLDWERIWSRQSELPF